MKFNDKYKLQTVSGNGIYVELIRRAGVKGVIKPHPTALIIDLTDIRTEPAAILRVLFSDCQILKKTGVYHWWRLNLTDELTRQSLENSAIIITI